MVTREAIAAALSSVPGVTGYPTKTGPISPGDGWPVWTGTRYPNTVPGGVRIGSWYVLVALNDTGNDGTVSEADPLVEPVFQALVGIGLQVDVVEPAKTMVTDTSSGVPVLRYTAHD